MTPPLTGTHGIAGLISALVPPIPPVATPMPPATPSIIPPRWGCPVVTTLMSMWRMTTVTPGVLVTAVSAVTTLGVLMPAVISAAGTTGRINHRAARVTLGLVTTLLILVALVTTSGVMNDWRGLLMNHRRLKYNLEIKVEFSYFWKGCYK